LVQIAAHKITGNSETIRERFSNCPNTLLDLAKELAPRAHEYTQLHLPSLTSKLSENQHSVDLLAYKWFIDKCYVGLVTGTFLTIRIKTGDSGAAGEVLNCPLCHVPAYQEHFLNQCPSNQVPRKILSCSVPSWFVVKPLQENNFFLFYLSIRSLLVSLAESLSVEGPVFMETCFNLARGASEMATLFTSNALALFDADSSS